MWIATIIDKGDFGREICRYCTDSEMRAHEIGNAKSQKLNEHGVWHDYNVTHTEYLK